jgi:hypothetical protein
MTLILFSIFLLCITLLPWVLYRKSQGHDVPPILAILSTTLFFFSPIVLLLGIIYYIIHLIILIIVGVFS